jgi:hypothetical protein
MWDGMKLITPANQQGVVQYLGTFGKLGLAELGGSGNPIVESAGGAGKSDRAGSKVLPQLTLAAGTARG